MQIPWSEGKDQLTRSYKIFLACWAKRLSWKETADIFSTSWNRVYKSVKDEECYKLLQEYISKNQAIWYEDIGYEENS